ncbi:hypothetical protein Nepgr_000282 [Nepenthes gracilis]|uniref:Uncharacterized protein n=1 Tax=Nepenthes gracilis TaxID=150966 RepID=A0AAD3RWP9_NEPGR|nr:hypothetical protein Nepgr_000282 [Nepenthes gracilis]
MNSRSVELKKFVMIVINTSTINFSYIGFVLSGAEVGQCSSSVVDTFEILRWKADEEGCDFLRVEQGKAKRGG